MNVFFEVSNKFTRRIDKFTAETLLTFPGRNSKSAGKKVNTWLFFAGSMV